MGIRTEEPRFEAAQAGEAWADATAWADACESAGCTIPEARVAFYASRGYRFSQITRFLGVPRYQSRDIVERSARKLRHALNLQGRQREHCREILQAFKNRMEFRSGEPLIGVLPEHENRRRVKGAADPQAFRQVTMRGPLVTPADLQTKLLEKEPLLVLQVMADYVRDHPAAVAI